MTKLIEPSPQDRLAASRRAIVHYMRDGETASHDRPYSGESEFQDLATPPPADGSTWQFFRRAVHVWWHHHPAQLALALTRPALNRYADKRPLRLLGLAAGAGAAVVWIRPWRLVSITGLVLAALKSSEVSTLVLSLLYRPTKKTFKESND